MTEQARPPLEYRISPQRDLVELKFALAEMRLNADQLKSLAAFLLELRGRMDPPPPIVPNGSIQPLPATDLYVSQYRGRLPTQAGCNILFRSASLGFFNFPASAQSCQQIVRDLTTVMMPGDSGGQA